MLPSSFVIRHGAYGVHTGMVIRCVRSLEQKAQLAASLKP